ncbi:hypothetical protein PWT90_06889 [Aphanocladium album]|nr:hypothetical protein PWT90_06889 [Aphanocladium album]
MEFRVSKDKFVTNTYEGDQDGFKRDVVNQFTWRYREPLRFISLFSDKDHANNWALREPWHVRQPFEGGEPWKLYVINAALLKDATLFRLAELVERLQLEIPRSAQQHIKDAYICLHRIPASAIIAEQNSEQVAVGRRCRFGESEALQYDTYDYLDEHSGGEYEALQENWNTLLEKNMEYSW